MKTVSDDTLQKWHSAVKEEGAEVFRAVSSFRELLDSSDVEKHSLVANLLLERLDSYLHALDKVQKAYSGYCGQTAAERYMRTSDTRSLHAVMRAYCGVLDASDLQFTGPKVPFFGSFTPERFRDPEWLDKLEAMQREILTKFVKPAVEHFCVTLEHPESYL